MTLTFVLSEVVVSIVSTLGVLSARAPLGLQSLTAAPSSAPTPDEWLEGIAVLGSEIASRARTLPPPFRRGDFSTIVGAHAYR